MHICYIIVTSLVYIGRDTIKLSHSTLNDSLRIYAMMEKRQLLSSLLTTGGYNRIYYANIDMAVEIIRLFGGSINLCVSFHCRTNKKETLTEWLHVTQRILANKSGKLPYGRPFLAE